MKHLLILILAASFLSCEQHERKSHKNDSFIISTDLMKLSELINLEYYKPTQVQFKYFTYNNSGDNQRVTIPGPSDNYLEAILYYDDSTFQRLITGQHLLSTATSKEQVSSYNFEWLNDQVKKEFEDFVEFEEYENSHVKDPHFFIKASLMHGGYFKLKNKILLKLNTI